MYLRPLTLAARLTAALLLPIGANALAQSSYTLTTLGKPSGAVSYVPTTLDKIGTVRGGMFSVTGYAFDPTTGCFFCAMYTNRDVSWGSGTGSTASASLGKSAFFTLQANDQGVQVGSYRPGKYRSDLFIPSSSTAGTPRDKANAPLADGQLAVIRNGTLSTPAYPAQVRAMVIGGINNLGWIALTAEEKDPADAFSERSVGMVYRDGVFTRLDSAGYVNADVRALNDAGTVAGLVTEPGSGKTLLALWQNGQIAQVGDLLSGRFRLTGFNAVGQVLVQSYDTPESLLWFNGAVTPITDPQGRRVLATGLNDSGTVVGCTQVLHDPNTVVTRADFTPFIWKNGVMQDLAALVAAKGVKLPSGTRLGCPWAINNSGTVLTYHYKVSAPDTITWVKLNAKP